MAKKSAADIKKEADEINEHIAKARKKTLNFALLIAKEGVILEAHPTKGPDVMRRLAKGRGGGPKGTQGQMNVRGKNIELTCEDEDFPPNLGKVAKKYFSELGIAFRVILFGPTGQPVGEADDEDDDVTEDTKAPAASEGGGDSGGDAPVAQGTGGDDDAAKAKEDQEREELKKRAEALEKEIKKAAENIGEAGAALGEAIADFLKAGVEDKLDAAKDALSEIQAKLEEAKKKAGSVNPDALRDALAKEFGEIEDKVDLLVENGQKGVSKKAEQLAAMFQKEVSGDLKKAGAVLSLLKTFVQTEVSKLEQAGNAVGKGAKAVGDAAAGVADGVGKAVENVGDAVKKGAGEAKKTAQGVFDKIGKAAKGVFGKVSGAANGIARAASKVAGKLAETASNAANAAEVAAQTAQGAVAGAGQAVADAGVQAGRAVDQVGDAAAEFAKKAKEAVEAAEAAARTAAAEAEKAAKDAAAAAQRAAEAAQRAVDEADEKAAKAADAAAAAARKLAEAARQTAETAAKTATDNVQLVEDATNAAIDTAQRAAQEVETKARGLLGGIADMISRVAGGAEDGAESLVGQARDALRQAGEVANQAAQRAGQIGEAAQGVVGQVQSEIEAKVDEAIAAVTAIAERLAEAGRQAERAANEAASAARSVAQEAVSRASDAAQKVNDLATEAGTALADAARQAATAAQTAAQTASEAAQAAEDAAARAAEAATRLAQAVSRAADGVIDRATEEAARAAEDAARQARERAEAAAREALEKVAEAERLAEELLAQAQAEADRKLQEAQALFDRVTNPLGRAAEVVGNEAKEMLDQATAAGGEIADFFGGLLGDFGNAGGRIQQGAARLAEELRRRTQQGVDTAIDAIERTRLEIEERVNSKIARIEARAEQIAAEAQRRAEQAKADAEVLLREAEEAAQDAVEDGADLVSDTVNTALEAAKIAAAAAAAAAIQAAAEAAAIRAAIQKMKDEARERVEDFLEDFSEEAIEAAETAADEAARAAETALNDARTRAEEVKREAQAVLQAIEAEVARKQAEAEALLGQVESAATGLLGGIGNFVAGAFDNAQDNANRLIDFEKKVLGGLGKASGKLFDKLSGMLAEKKQRAEGLIGNITDAVRDALFGQQKSVQEFRAEAMAELAKIEAALAEGDKLAEDTAKAQLDFASTVGETLAKESIYQYQDLIDARVKTRSDAMYCVNDTKIWINDIDRSLITLEDRIRNKLDPSQGTIDQTNAQRAVEGIREETAKALAFVEAAKAENKALMALFADEEKMLEEAIAEVIGEAKEIEKQLESALAEAENATEAGQIKALKDKALNLGIEIDQLLLTVNEYGGPMIEDCMKTLTEISGRIDDLKQAVLRLEAIAEVAEEEEADQDELGTVPTEEEDEAPAAGGGTGGGEGGGGAGAGDGAGDGAESPAAPAGEIAEAVGSGAPNKPADVNTIKGLLNDFCKLLNYPTLTLDSKADKACIDNIRLFQSLVVKIRPDGVISPGKTTFKALKAGPAAVKDDFPTAREDGDTTEYPPNVTGDIAGVKDHVLNVLKAVSSHYKGAKIHVTSGLRDADDQARVMWKYWVGNLKNGEIYGYLRRNPDILKALQDHYKAGEEAEFKKIVVKHAASLSDHLYGRAVDVPINLNPKLVAAISSILRKVVEKSCIHFDDRDRTVPSTIDASITDKWPK